MTGLRERQKADRTRRILEAASSLFRAQGYDAVRIEDIAAAAEVSAGTCYNYFSTKGDLLLAIVSMEVEEVVEVGARGGRGPPPDVARRLAG
jgi:AcrR family transcriptional regulator